MNIQQKLVEVKKSIDSFKKDASGYGYKYVPGSQILKEIKPKMDELGILLEQHLIYPVVTQTAKGYMITSQMKMIWVNAEKPEDRIEIDWFMTGEQKDPSQSFGSGLTYAERYFMLKFFNIPTDEDDPDKLLAGGDKTTPKTASTAVSKPKAGKSDDNSNGGSLENLLGLAFDSDKIRKEFVNSFKGGEKKMIEVLKSRINREAGINE